MRLDAIEDKNSGIASAFNKGDAKRQHNRVAGAGAGPGNVFKIVLQEGRNRQIRKMCEARSLKVKALHRIRFSGVTLDGMKGPGDVKELTPAELASLTTLHANNG